MKICAITSLTGISWKLIHNPTSSSKVLTIHWEEQGTFLSVVLCDVDIFYLEAEEIIGIAKLRTAYTQNLQIFKMKTQDKRPKKWTKPTMGYCQLTSQNLSSGDRMNLRQLRVSKAILNSFSLSVSVHYYALEGRT